jgi:threonine dehydrogenase-like Zn-dependent dehydrogenase
MEAHGLTELAAVDFAKSVVKLATDRPHVLREAIQTAGKGTTRSLAGVYTGFVDSIPFGAAFAKGLTLVVSMEANDAARGPVRLSAGRRSREVVRRSASSAGGRSLQRVRAVLALP